MVINIVIICAAIVLVSTVSLYAINILQKGTSKKDGRTMEQILGKPTNEAGPEDLMQLRKSDIMQLFFAASAPDFKELSGEYQAGTVPVGVMAFSADIFLNRFFGSGKWLGKAFNPRDDKTGSGYNVFRNRKGRNLGKIERMRRMENYLGPSCFAEGDSYHLDYSVYNSGVVGTMHDELRKINENLYLGLGHIIISGGPINPLPFYVQGPAKEFEV